MKESNIVPGVTGLWTKLQRLIIGILLVLGLLVGVKYLMTPTWNSVLTNYLVEKMAVKDSVIEQLYLQNIQLQERLKKKEICS